MNTPYHFFVRPLTKKTPLASFKCVLGIIMTDTLLCSRAQLKGPLLQIVYHAFFKNQP